MYKILKSLALILLSMLIFTACKKAGTDLELNDGQFQSTALSASTTNLVLTQTTENDRTLRLIWTAASFGPNPEISYSLEMSPASDTANNWANAKRYVIGSNKGSYAFLNKDLNAALNDLHLPNGIVTPIAFRIKADVNQNGGTASTVPAAYTNVAVVNITTYGITLYVPGEYQGWNPGAAQVLPPIPNKAGLFEGYAYFSGTGTQYFKFTNAPDWNHTNYGDGGNGTFSTDGAAGGLSVPSGGYYELMANLNNNTWKVTKTTWGIIGDATPGGWNNDTQMTYDPATQVWKVTANMVHNGSFKFRANNEWAIDFGIDNNGKLVYADNPFLGYTPNLNNLTVPEDGNYTITLDLHVSGNYNYILHKN